MLRTVLISSRTITMLNLVNELIEQLIEHQQLRVKDFIPDSFVTSTPSALQWNPVNTDTKGRSQSVRITRCLY